MPRRYKSQPDRVTALKLPAQPRSRLDPDLQKYFVACDERIGFLPNVLAAYSFDQAVREMSGDPALGELLVMNYRAAKLSRRHRAMLDFAHDLTVTPAEAGEDGRAALRKAGFKDREIWDIAAVTSFFNMTNRMATAIDMMPNEEYHSANR